LPDCQEDDTKEKDKAVPVSTANNDVALSNAVKNDPTENVHVDEHLFSNDESRHKFIKF